MKNLTDFKQFLYDFQLTLNIAFSEFISDLYNSYFAYLFQKCYRKYINE